MGDNKVPDPLAECKKAAGLLGQIAERNKKQVEKYEVAKKEWDIKKAEVLKGWEPWKKKVGDAEKGNKCDYNYGGGGAFGYVLGSGGCKENYDNCGNCYKCNVSPGTYSCSASCGLDVSKESKCSNSDAWAQDQSALVDVPKPTDFKMEPVPENISCQDCSNHLNIQDSKMITMQDVQQLNMCIAGGGEAPGQLGMGNLTILWEKYKKIAIGGGVFIFIFFILLILF